MLPELDNAPYSTLPAVKRPSFRNHPNWPDIHADIVTSSLTPKEICEKYQLRTESGALAIIRVAKYRKQVLEKFKDLFARANELEQQAIRGEVLGTMRQVDTAATEAFELARDLKETRVSRGKKPITYEVATPQFGAMKEHLEVRMNAAAKLAEIAGVGPSAQPQAPMYQDNRVVQILALPKAPGISARAPLRIVEAQKETG